MPRKPRFNLTGVHQHIIQRGNNREPCFYSEQGYRRYLDDLKESANKYDCRIHAYVSLKQPELGYSVKIICRSCGYTKEKKTTERSCDWYGNDPTARFSSFIKTKAEY